MDETEKRIIGNGILGNIAAIMVIIGILGGMGIIDPLTLTIIETLMAPNLAMMYAMVRYKFKIKTPLDLESTPKLASEPEEPKPIV